ncbi:hypothetical protein M6B38_363320 [Iris pallida]|uniref:Uncharacterized protein n=1 Tax=Iris pallida TaxID=29817 RepID=A0AAX6GIB3_IRIPA|nr:hypothetical protein M6B38_382175 [Iris pallida]KAJ6828444.1 hypothetical protein M6B38_363320 [Iris pallida]
MELPSRIRLYHTRMYIRENSSSLFSCSRLLESSHISTMYFDTGPVSSFMS